MERLIDYPVSLASFSEPETRPDMMGYGQLRRLIGQLKEAGTNVRRYTVELASKVTLPLMNMVVCLIAFAGSTQPQLRGNLKGLGMSLGWGLLYYFGVGFGEGLGKKGGLFLPVIIAVWGPHLLAILWCLKILRRTT